MPERHREQAQLSREPEARHVVVGEPAASRSWSSAVSSSDGRSRTRRHGTNTRSPSRAPTCTSSCGAWRAGAIAGKRPASGRRCRCGIGPAARSPIPWSPARTAAACLLRPTSSPSRGRAAWTRRCCRPVRVAQLTREVAGHGGDSTWVTASRAGSVARSARRGCPNGRSDARSTCAGRWAEGVVEMGESRTPRPEPVTRDHYERVR